MVREDSSPFDAVPHKRTPDGWRLSPDGFYWHATTKDRLRSIEKLGLTTNRRSRWSNRLGRSLGGRLVYMSSFYDSAAKWAVKMRYDWKRDDIVLIKLTPPPTLYPDTCIESQLLGRTFWYSQTDVSPTNLHRVLMIDESVSRAVVESHKTNTLMREPS